jgi:L,D-peptidoglycan transpeptidase YkuD (ErfK/YbiS/YcfS/YnhG family)
MLALAAGVAVSVVGARRHEVLRVVAAQATGALAEARRAEAAVFAPDELLVAEAALRDTRAAYRIEEMRLWPVPDSARITAAFGDAERKAQRALGLARDRRATAVSEADVAIVEADRAVAASASLAGTIHLGSQRRSLLARAQLALTEARVYRREDDFGSATVKARHATSLAGQVRDRAAEVAARYADAETVARWRRWKDETIAWSRREGGPVIIVSKEAHLLALFVRGELVKTYRAEMGFNWIADKSREGDGATPEGRYRVVKAIGASLYYKALLLDYPNMEDRAEFARARRRGDMPLSDRIGGAIEIHGEGGRGRDWTRGCVALTNGDMDELFARAPIGTPVTIVGSDDYGPMADLAVRKRNGETGR